MELIYKGAPITPAEAIGIAENHGITLEDAEYIVECLETGKEYDLRDYAEARNGEYVKCFVAFLSKVTPGNPAPLVVKDRGAATVCDVVVVDDSETILRDVLSTTTNALSDHFDQLPDGRWKMRLDNPPTIEDAYRAALYAKRLRDTSDALSEYAEWSFASLIYECEEYFGEEFSFSQIAEATRKNELYCRKAYRIAKWAAEHGKPEIPATNAMEIICRKVDDPDLIQRALDVAEKHRLRQGDCRKLIDRIILGDDPDDFAAETYAEVKEKLTKKGKDFWVAHFPKGWYCGYLPEDTCPLSSTFAFNVTKREGFIGKRRVDVDGFQYKKRIQTFQIQELEQEVAE